MVDGSSFLIVSGPLGTDLTLCWWVECCDNIFLSQLVCTPITPHSPFQASPSPSVRWIDVNANKLPGESRLSIYRWNPPGQSGPKSWQRLGVLIMSGLCSTKPAKAAAPESRPQSVDPGKTGFGGTLQVQGQESMFIGPGIKNLTWAGGALWVLKKRTLGQSKKFRQVDFV